MPKEEFLGKTVFDLYSAKIAQGMTNDDSEVLKSGRPKLNIIEQYESASGIRLVQTDKVPIFDKNGNPAGLVAFAQDITERKKVEMKLRESEEKYRSLAENSKDAIAVVDFKGNVLFANKAAEKLTGYTLQEGKGMNIRVVTPKRLWLKSIAMLLKAKLGKTIPYFEYELKKKDGTLIPVETGGQAIFKDGKPVAIQIITRDITERKKAEDALRLSEAKYRELINGMNDTAWVIDLDANFVDVNDAAVKVLGYSREELLSMGPQDIDNSLSKEQIRDLVKRMPVDQVQVFETAHTTKDGKIIPVEISSSLVTYKGKQAVLSIARNITERKNAEEALKDSENRYRFLFSSMLDGFAYCRMIWGEKGEPADFVYLEVNDAFEKLTGLKTHDVLGKNASAAIPGIKELHPELFELYGRVASTGKEEQLEICFKPLAIWLSISVYSPRKDHFVAVFENITARKKTEEEMRKSELILQNSSDSIIVTDLQGKITAWNKGAAEIFGYSAQEILGEPITKIVKPEEKEQVAPAQLEQIRKGQVSAGEWEGIRKGGSTVWLILTTTLLKNSQNEPIGMVGFGKDITDRKKAEGALDRTMNELVLVNEKLGVVGGLTRHDVRNKLSAVTGYAYLLKKKYADQADIIEGLGKMEKAVKDAGEIFDCARMYEQLGVEELKYVDVEKTLNAAVALFSGLNFKVVNDCQGLSLLADSLLRQLFYNFVDNTGKYGEKTTAARVYFENAEGGGLRLIYEDDGVGISAKDKLKLFTEGFSTGGSTGFGLFLSKKMIDVYGWQIQETGEPGKGAKFVITIPRLNQKGRENLQIA